MLFWKTSMKTEVQESNSRKLLEKFRLIASSSDFNVKHIGHAHHQGRNRPVGEYDNQQGVRVFLYLDVDWKNPNLLLDDVWVPLAIVMSLKGGLFKIMQDSMNLQGTVLEGATKEEKFQATTLQLIGPALDLLKCSETSRKIWIDIGCNKGLFAKLFLGALNVQSIIGIDHHNFRVDFMRNIGYKGKFIEKSVSQLTSSDLPNAAAISGFLLINPSTEQMVVDTIKCARKYPNTFCLIVTDASDVAMVSKIIAVNGCTVRKSWHDGRVLLISA